MRLFYLWFIPVCFILSSLRSSSQNSFTGLNGTTVNVPCSSNCNSITVKVTHLKTSSDYTLINIPYIPFNYTTSFGTELTTLYSDDKYSGSTPIGFPFCFYDSSYTNAIVGSNGLITFDEFQANKGNSYLTTLPIPYAGGIPNSTGSTYYPPASIMAAYTDLNPASTASPCDRKIECRTEGTAPFRRFIASFYHLGTFGANACSRDASCRAITPATFQIVIYEQSGLIDLFIENKSCQSTTAQGKTIMGIQNWQRNRAVAAPGRNSVAGWTASNEGWRFVPSGSVSRYNKAEIYDLSGNLLQVTSAADTATTTAGLLDINFNNICFSGASKQFIIKTYFTSCPSGNPLISNDTITVNRGNLTAQTSSTPAACSPTGTATITLPAGAGPYTFSLGTNPSITSANNSYTFTGLIAGNYTLIGTNISGCSATATVTVGLNGTLIIQATAIAPSCAGLTNGSIVVTTQNGTPPFQYNINNAAYQASNIFSNLVPGSYVIGAKDSSGCVVTNYIVNLGAPSPLAVSIAPTNVSCNGGNNGTVAVSFSSTATPLQYSLDGLNFQSSNIFNGLPAGNYTVYFKDANNCGGTQSFSITQPSVLRQNIVKQDAVCYGQANGKITVTAFGGTPGYQFSLNGTTYQPGNIFNVIAGTYTVYAKDAGGCIITGSVTINQPAILSINSQTQNTSCNGGADGKITLTASGGTAPYQYSINGATYQNSNAFNVLQGAYTITVKDANGCTSFVSDTVRLTNNLTLSLSADTIICEGMSASLTAVTNATQFQWTPAGTLDNATIPNPIASPKDTTLYVLTASLGVCSIKDSLQVAVRSAPVPDAGNNDEVCFGQGYVLKGSGGVSYQWSPTTYFNPGSTASSQNPDITPSQTTSYSLRVTDANGCISLQPATVRIIVTPPIKVIAAPRDTVVAKGDIIQLRAASPVIDYIWAPSLGLDNSAKQNPVATIDKDVTYVVTAYTGAGCRGTDTVRIKVYNGPEIYVSTAFTPNGDGKNDMLKPFPVGIKELKFFRVYNRWGQLIFQTSTLNAGWDGKINGVVQPVATYVWVLQAVTKDNIIISKRGTATLIR